MKNKIIILFLFPVFCFSQQIVKGKIIIESPEISGILVVNLTNQSETKTDGFGRFSIKANAGDLLILSASHIHKKRLIIENDSFKNEIQIELEALPYEIEAVEIVRSNITSESLGIVPKGQKRYTTAERRLYTSESGGVLGSLIDIASGRRRMLKNILEMEREDKRVEYVSNLFTEDFFMKTLKIDPNNITEFKYFAVYEISKNINKKERNEYIRQLSKNDLELLLIPLSKEYLERRNEKYTKSEN